MRPSSRPSRRGQEAQNEYYEMQVDGITAQLTN